MENTAVQKPAGLQQKKPVFISLRLQLLVGFLLLFGVAFGASYYWFYTFSDDLVNHRFYNFTTDVAMERLKDDLNTYLLGISAQIDGDEFAALVAEGKPREDGYTDDPRYWKQVDLLFQMRNIDPRTRYYTYVKGTNPNEVVYVGSSGARLDPPAGVTFLQAYAFSPADAAVILRGLEETTFYLTIYDDEFGSWISGYTPIYNSNGDSVGALGIDMRADYVRTVQQDLEENLQKDVLQNVQDAIIFATGVTAIGVIIMVFLISGILTRPIVALTRAAEHIGEGNYEQDLSHLTPGRFSDEIGKLAEVFEIMVGKVHQREEKLKKQVAELQIVIDEQKRQEQLEEIVESDFFRDLQAKARKIRQDFSAAGQKPPEASET
jgi:HAMP domain-containing protein